MLFIQNWVEEILYAVCEELNLCPRFVQSEQAIQEILQNASDFDEEGLQYELKTEIENYFC
jgi:hypothetical protein